MTTVNTRLQENPKLQKMPRNEREWVQYQNELAKWVRNVVKLGDGSITDANGTTISGLDEMPGKVSSQTALSTASVFNKSSVQDASPLTAIDAGADASVEVAAHSVYYDGNTLAYNSGTVTGLSFSTKYYIYTDDPDKDGGAVTYLATTTPTDIVGSTDRYYVGEVTTPADGAADTSGGWGAGSGSGNSQIP